MQIIYQIIRSYCGKRAHLLDMGLHLGSTRTLDKSLLFPGPEAPHLYNEGAGVDIFNLRREVQDAMAVWSP